MAKPNHGSAVSEYARTQREARDEGGPRGIGPAVSAFARNKNQDPDFEDGVITVVKDEGGTATFTNFADALAYSDDGDTLQVGAGTYEEVFDLDESVTIIGEEGAIVDGSGFTPPTAGTQSTIELFDGFSGGSISGLTVVAIQGGQALLSPIAAPGGGPEDIALTDNIFDAGDNVSGSLVYFNAGTDGVLIEDNVFEGDALTASPLLGIEADNVQVNGNTFNSSPGGYPEVEVFEGYNGTTSDVTFSGNNSLPPQEVLIV